MTPWQRHERHEQWLANQQAQNLGAGAAPLPPALSPYEAPGAPQTQSYVMDPSLQAAAMANAPDPSGASTVVSASPNVPSDQTTDPMLDQAIADSDNADAQSGAIDPTSGASQSILDAGADFGYSSGRVGDFRHMKGTFGVGAEFGASSSGGKKGGGGRGGHHRHRHSSQQSQQSPQSQEGGGGAAPAPDPDDDMGAEFGGMVSASQLATLAASNVAQQSGVSSTTPGTTGQNPGHRRHHHSHFLGNQGQGNPSGGSYSSQMMAPPTPLPTSPYPSTYDDSSYGCDQFGVVMPPPPPHAVVAPPPPPSSFVSTPGFSAIAARNAALGNAIAPRYYPPPPPGLVSNAYGQPFPYQGPQGPGFSSGGGHRRQWRAQAELSQAMADQSAMQYAQQGMADQGYLPGSYDDSDDDSGDYDVSGDFGGPTKAGKQHESDNLARSRTTVRS